MKCIKRLQTTKRDYSLLISEVQRWGVVNSCFLFWPSTRAKSAKQRCIGVKMKLDQILIEEEGEEGDDDDDDIEANCL